MTKHIIIVAAALFLGFLLGRYSVNNPEKPAGEPPQKADWPQREPLARINDRIITEEIFRYWWEKRVPPHDTAEGREALLEKLIERAVLVENAETAGLGRDPVVAEGIESLLIARLKERELMPRLAEVAVTDEEARAFYEEERTTRFRHGIRVRTAVLWFETRGIEELEQRFSPKLLKVHRRLTTNPDDVPAGRGFGELAVNFSEHHASRYRGGIVGWLEVGADYDPFHRTILTIATQLEEAGACSDIVRNDAGTFLVRLLERRPAGSLEFVTVKSRIKDELVIRKRSEIEKRLQEKLWQQVAVTRYPEKLKGLSGLPTAAARTEVVDGQSSIAN